MWQDVKFGLRMLAKTPGFTAIAVVTLAFGIGANTAIFSAVNGIVLKRLPYADPSQLVDLTAMKLFPGAQVMFTMNADAGTWQKVRAQTPAIAQMAFYKRHEYTMTGEGAPELVSGALVSNDFFSTLGTKPIAGRPILPADTQPGAKPVIVVSYAFWRSYWGGSPDVLGRAVTLDGKNYAVVGVTPPDFNYPILTNENVGKGVWLALPVESAKNSDDPEVNVIARLKEGVTLKAADAQLKTVSARIPGVLSEFIDGAEFTARPVKKRFNQLDNALLILFGAVGFVLLIACVNISGLLLARSWSRQREVAIREALGASRLRILRQFLTESILLALAGGALGLLFSYWGVRVLRAITPTNLPEHGHFDLNANILWFTLAISLLAGILFGLAPALHASGKRAGAALKDGFGGLFAGGSARRPRVLRSALVIVEVALAVMLVIGATLVARSFEKLTSQKLGFRTDHILTMDANFSRAICDEENPVKTLAGCKATIAEVVDNMRAVPGVQTAAYASAVPMNGWSLVADLKFEGSKQEASIASGAFIGRRLVSPDYFRAFRMRLLSGREFTDADVGAAPRVCIVDEAFAKKYLSDSALGRRISGEVDDKKRPEWMEIVGIVQTARDLNPQLEAAGEIYIPFAQADYFQDERFAARTSADPMVIAPAVRQAIWSVAKDTPITDLTTMDQIVSESVAEPRFQAILLGSFGALGLVLAMVGIYGVISYGVTQRTREIGVRMALGAQPGNVLRMVIFEGMFLAGAGIIIGIGGALALGRVLRSMLFEIKPSDPETFALVTVALAVVALAACWIPARRAMRVDPMEALRYE